MTTNCAYCRVDTGGNHEVGCPNHVITETLTMSKQDREQLTEYVDYKREREERELAEMGDETK